MSAAKDGQHGPAHGRANKQLRKGKVHDENRAIHSALRSPVLLIRDQEHHAMPDVKIGMRVGLVLVIASGKCWLLATEADTRCMAMALAVTMLFWHSSFKCMFAAGVQRHLSAWSTRPQPRTCRISFLQPTCSCSLHLLKNIQGSLLRPRTCYIAILPKNSPDRQCF